MLNIDTNFLGRCFPSEGSSLSCVAGGLFSMHVHRNVEKLFMFVPWRGKLDPIKELHFLFFKSYFFVVLGGIMEKSVS